MAADSESLSDQRTLRAWLEQNRADANPLEGLSLIHSRWLKPPRLVADPRSSGHA